MSSKAKRRQEIIDKAVVAVDSRWDMLIDMLEDDRPDHVGRERWGALTISALVGFAEAILERSAEAVKRDPHLAEDMLRAREDTRRNIQTITALVELHDQKKETGHDSRH